MKMRNHARAHRAFTLIELMVVILILAILAALIVPRVVGRTADAKRAKAASDIATLSSLLQQYHIDTDQYPTTEQGLNALRVAPSGANNWRGPYTSKDIPTMCRKLNELLGMALGDGPHFIGPTTDDAWYLDPLLESSFLAHDSGDARRFLGTPGTHAQNLIENIRNFARNTHQICR